MNVLDITLTKKLRPYTDIYLDGEIINVKKRKKQYVAQHSTANSTSELTIKSYSRFQTKFWWLLEIFYFLISVFGIFDQRFGKYCYTTHCKIKLNLNEQTNIKLRVIEPRNNGAVVKVESDVDFEEIENIYKIDRGIEKKTRILRTSKIFTFLIVVALVVTLVTLGRVKWDI